MTTETLIQKVREKRGSLNSENEQILAMAMQILHDTENASLPPPSEENFVSRNITPEEYEALLRLEKRHYLAEAEKLNIRWIANQFNSLNAKWIVVIDGQVVMHGATLDTHPEDEEFLAICERTGKFPFVFISPRVFDIEERPTVWHKTKELDDAYPALSVAVLSKTKRFDTEADLDTGAVDCYCSLELLTANKVVKIHSKEFEYTAEHLSRSFSYFIKPLWLELIDEVGISRRWRTAIICVADWKRSPFISINPSRVQAASRGI
ncbi:hypothetical protein L0337_34260 [candidate division KSB1 bacterium]|nr:hypothetical protein [candidate division KSB1 bacterium]